MSSRQKLPPAALADPLLHLAAAQQLRQAAYGGRGLQRIDAPLQHADLGEQLRDGELVLFMDLFQAGLDGIQPIEEHGSHGRSFRRAPIARSRIKASFTRFS